jgi:YHS domain-containing protein
MKRLSHLILAGLVAVLLLGTISLAQTKEDRLALKGYDPVAYFVEQRAMLGSSRYQYEWDGALYQFASAKHLELFKEEPDRYLPQYKSWCAASVAKGVKVYGNPEWWLVVDGHLYLFGKPIGPDLMKENPEAMKTRAEANWAKVSELPTPPMPDYMRVTAQPQ